MSDITNKILKVFAENPRIKAINNVDSLAGEYASRQSWTVRLLASKLIRDAFIAGYFKNLHKGEGEEITIKRPSQYRKDPCILYENTKENQDRIRRGDLPL